MKRTISRIMMIVLAAISCGMLWSCDKDDDKDNELTKQEEACYVRPWKAYPNSYIKNCDWRFTFRFIKCERVEGGLIINYVITNTGFDQKVTATFSFPSNRVAARDDLGNTYLVGTGGDVTSMIDGRQFSYSGQGVSVTFMPNQAIKGEMMIRDFDQNAYAVSSSIRVEPSYSSGLKFMYDYIDFVNIPIGEPLDNIEHM